VAGAESSATTAQARLTQRRILLIVLLVAAVLVAFFAVQNLAVSAVYYLTPTEARDKHIGPGTPARLGGLVVPGTLHYDPASRALVFGISDGTTNVAVVGAGAPPALLKEGAGAVVEGAFAPDGTFRATSVIAKHDEKYAPPSPGRTPEHSTP
jgi:cytochrome c-type biogenesis protein CcmE